jgi:hypothetical protein
MTLARLMIVATFASAIAAPAMACDLDDCALPRARHAVEPVVDDAKTPPKTELRFQRWGWIPHDLALARTALEDGDRTEAIVLLAGIDRAMRAQASSAVTAVAQIEARLLHAVVGALMLRAGGIPVAELPVLKRVRSWRPSAPSQG